MHQLLTILGQRDFHYEGLSISTLCFFFIIFTFTQLLVNILNQKINDVSLY